MPTVLGGLGVSILTTSRGVMTGRAAQQGGRRRRDALQRLVAGARGWGLGAEGRDGCCTAPRSAPLRWNRTCHELARNQSRFRRASPSRSTAPRSTSRARRARCARRCRPASSWRSRTASCWHGAERDEKALGKFHGLARSLVTNAVQGVTEGWKRELDIVGVGYRAEMKGKQVHLRARLLAPGRVRHPDGDRRRGGEADPHHRDRRRPAAGRPGGGQHAPLRKPDPYQQKGVRYTGEVLKKKAGKTGA